MKTYRCWKKTCELFGNVGRIPEGALERRKVDKLHTDYVCPKCEGVIICDNTF